LTSGDLRRTSARLREGLVAHPAIFLLGDLHRLEESHTSVIMELITVTKLPTAIDDDSATLPSGMLTFGCMWIDNERKVHRVAYVAFQLESFDSEATTLFP
jgi:hypothetical protein